MFYTEISKVSRWTLNAHLGHFKFHLYIAFGFRPKPVTNASIQTIRSSNFLFCIFVEIFLIYY